MKSATRTEAVPAWALPDIAGGALARNAVALFSRGDAYRHSLHGAFDAPAGRRLGMEVEEALVTDHWVGCAAQSTHLGYDPGLSVASSRP